MNLFFFKDGIMEGVTLKHFMFLILKISLCPWHCTMTVSVSDFHYNPSLHCELINRSCEQVCAYPGRWYCIESAAEWRSWACPPAGCGGLEGPPLLHSSAGRHTCGRSDPAWSGCYWNCEHAWCPQGRDSRPVRWLAVLCSYGCRRSGWHWSSSLLAPLPSVFHWKVTVWLNSCLPAFPFVRGRSYACLGPWLVTQECLSSWNLVWKKTRGFRGCGPPVPSALSCPQDEGPSVTSLFVP